MTSRTSRTARALRVAGLLVLVACGTSRGLEPRYVAVHNTLASLGLVQVGPVQRGSLAEGQAARLALQLPAGCSVVVALGGSGVEDLDVALVDEGGQTVARDTTHDAEPSVRLCQARPARRELTVRMARGAGEFVTATWSGAAPLASSGASAPEESPRVSAGSCASPTPLLVGVVNGTTRQGEAEHVGSCSGASSREVVHRLVLEKRQRVVLDLDAGFDTVLYVRRAECEDESTEVGCNDDGPPSRSGHAEHPHASFLDLVLEPGTYFVFVDGYGTEAGAYRLETRLEDVPTLADVCRAAAPVAVAAPVTGRYDDAVDHAGATCGGAAKGADVAHALDVPARARVRLTLTSPDATPVVHLRRTCTDERSEIGCEAGAAGATGASWAGMLEAGRYTVFADSEGGTGTGSYRLAVETAPEGGATTPGDSCSDAVVLAPSAAGDARADGDTFAAHDDLATRAAPGSPEVVYRLDVPTRSRVRASTTPGSARHLLALRRSCVDATTEVAAGASLDAVVPAGTYHLVVESASPTSFGRFGLVVRTRDQSAPESACRSAPLLPLGGTLKGTTAGAGDKFRASCAGPEDRQASSDRVFRLVVPRRARVRLALSTPTWDGVLALRRTCLDVERATSLRASEVACNNDHHDTRHSQIDATLEPGTYHVLVDGHAGGNDGDFTLAATLLD